MSETYQTLTVPLNLAGHPTSSDSELKRLQERHLKLLELLLSGYSKSQIASVLSLSLSAVCMITKSPLFQSELARRRAQLEKQSVEDIVCGRVKAKELLDEAAYEAAQVEVDLMTSDDPNIRLRAADKILDRTFGADDNSKQPSIVIQAGSLGLLAVALQESQDSRRGLEIKDGHVVSSKDQEVLLPGELVPPEPLKPLPISEAVSSAVSFSSSSSPHAVPLPPGPKSPAEGCATLQPEMAVCCTTADTRPT
jgi:hypothetical protein